MNAALLFSRNTRRVLALLLVAQMGAVTVEAQSERARERANENARFNRDREGDRGARRFMGDNEFIKEAYARGFAEEKLAQVAVKASQDLETQKAGHRIVNEQGRANADLKKLAESRNVTLTTDLTSQEKAIYDRLSQLQGAEFDRAYKDHLRNDYKRTIQLFQDAAQYSQDTTVRSTASQYANMFAEHAQVLGITGLGTATAGTTTSSSDRDLVRERESDRAATTPSTTTTGPLSAKDEQFLKRAYRMSRTEVEAAQLAAKNARDNALQRMAQTLQTDHSRMNQELSSMASRRGVNLGRELGEGQQDLVAKLKDLSGQSFDREYREYLERSHKNMSQLMTEGAASSDPDVRAFAQKYSAAIQQHLQSVGSSTK